MEKVLAYLREHLGVKMGIWIGVAFLAIMGMTIVILDERSWVIWHVIGCASWMVWVIVVAVKSYRIQQCWKDSEALLRHPDIGRNPNRGDSPLLVKTQALCNKLLREWGKDSLQGKYLLCIVAERHSTFEIRVRAIQRAFDPEKIIEQHTEPTTSHFTPMDFGRR